MDRVFYIYRHINPVTNEVFYIGKGTLNDKSKSFKKQYERAFDKSYRSLFWNSVFKKYGRVVEIIFEHNSESVIFEKEKEFINLYGRRDLNQGTLVNMTDGGEGGVGRIVSDCERLRISKLHKGKKISKETILAIKKANTGRKKTQEELTALSLANKGVNNSQYGQKGKDHPKYGFKESDATRRKKQIAGSNPMYIIKEGTRIDFICISDCAEYLNCTISNIKYADKKFKKGLTHKKGIFKDVYIEILNNK